MSKPRGQRPTLLPPPLPTPMLLDEWHSDLIVVLLCSGLTFSSTYCGTVQWVAASQRTLPGNEPLFIFKNPASHPASRPGTTRDRRQTRLLDVFVEPDRGRGGGGRSDGQMCRRRRTRQR